MMVLMIIEIIEVITVVTAILALVLRKKNDVHHFLDLDCTLD